ncbi:MAG: hypothetical protein PF542_06565 [Nanoarchaeota archaeon]|jgi:hypothetical protein|nr:hypothetical protein [Nanoarchaeota archaeon]
MKQKLRKEEVGFTQVKNNILNDKNLSFKAKGLFAYLYSKPNDWDFSSKRIKNDSIDGLDSTLSGLKELEEAGYLVRMRTKTGKVEYCLYHSVNPKRENPYQGKAQQGKTHSISNKEKIVIKKNTNTDDGVVLEEVEDTYKSKHKIAKQKGIKLKKTPRTSKQDKSFEVMQAITYYRDQAMLIHGMQFMKVQNESRNKVVRKLASNVDCDLKGLIDWWIDGAGEWAGYEPEQCFSIRMVERFLNKDSGRVDKIHNL